MGGGGEGRGGEGSSEVKVHALLLPESEADNLCRMGSHATGSGSD